MNRDYETPKQSASRSVIANAPIHSDCAICSVDSFLFSLLRRDPIKQRRLSTSHLFIILVGLVIDNIEEAELIYALGSGDDAKPVAELLLLQELLGAVISSACPRDSVPLIQEREVM